MNDIFDGVYLLFPALLAWRWVNGEGMGRERSVSGLMGWDGVMTSRCARLVVLVSPVVWTCNVKDRFRGSSSLRRKGYGEMEGSCGEICAPEGCGCSIFSCGVAVIDKLIIPDLHDTRNAGADVSAVPWVICLERSICRSVSM